MDIGLQDRIDEDSDDAELAERISSRAGETERRRKKRERDDGNCPVEYAKGSL